MPKQAKRPTRADKAAAAKAEKKTAAAAQEIRGTAKVMDTYAKATAHRAKHDAMVQQFHADISQYAGEERLWTIARAVDFVGKRLGKNGFANQWSRLVMSHQLIDFAKCLPRQSRTRADVARQIRAVYAKHPEEMTPYLNKSLHHLTEGKKERQVELAWAQAA
jgi:DNA-binding GntR family transcriptional regulator